MRVGALDGRWGIATYKFFLLTLLALLGTTITVVVNLILKLLHDMNQRCQPLSLTVTRRLAISRQARTPTDTRITTGQGAVNSARRRLPVSPTQQIIKKKKPMRIV